MPSLRDLSLQRNQRLNQLRVRINQSSKTNKSGSSFISSNSLNELTNDIVAQPAQDFNSSSTQESKQKKSYRSYIVPQKRGYEQTTSANCETSDLKTKLTPYMEALEKKTNAIIKRIIRKKLLHFPTHDSVSTN